MKLLQNKGNLWSKNMVLLQAFFLYSWLTNLQGTDSYYSCYALCGVLGALCLYDNYRARPAFGRSSLVGISFASVLFGLAAVLANYFLFKPITALMYLMNACLTLAGGFFVCFNVLCCALRRLPLKMEEGERRHPLRVFWFVFGSVALVDTVFLLFAMYPGAMTQDSVTTVAQCVKGVYNNIMPFYHTITFKLFYEIGMAIFGNATDAVALFHFAQILFLAFCFAYAVMTLYQIGVPKLGLGIVYGIYVFSFYNIIYSVTLWKDIPFSAALLLLVTALYRLMKQVGRRHWNYAVLIIGALGFSLWRTNGWYAFLAAFAVMFFLMRKKYKTLLIIMLLVLILCWVLINPVLDGLDVSPMNFVEAFGVPFQQFARVIWNDRPLTPEQTELLSMAFMLDRVKELYTPYTVDPIKFETFYYGNVDYITEHMVDYIKLYIELGLKYPGDYLEAWIEETRGYWNGGYLHWIYATGAEVEKYGIENGVRNPLISAAFQAFFRCQEKPGILQPLQSIGFQVWVVIGCFVLNILKKREEFLLSIPVLVLVVGLWLGTPVFADFRYAYPVFLCMPVILMTTLYHTKTET